MPFEAKSQLNWRNFFICCAISLGQWCFGYPSSVISVIISNESWMELMLAGKDAGTSTALTGATSGVFQAGAVINVIITAWALEALGRRNAMFYNALIGLFGGALITGSPNIGMFIAGRFFTGASAFGFLVATPVYTAELAPPALRGFFVGMNGVNISFGYLLAGIVGKGFSFTTGEVSWRAPAGIYLFFPLLITVIVLLSPESPRWLLMKGHADKAKEVTFSIHKVANDPDQQFAREEFYQMRHQIDIDRTLHTTWWDMFSKPSLRKRTAMVCFYSFLGQSTAILVLNNYGPMFYQALGYDSDRQLSFQVGWLTLGPPFCVFGAYYMDRLGRRPLMIAGIAGCCICMIILTAMYASFVGTDNKAGLAVGVAALYCFVAIYSVGVDVGGNVFYAEVFPNHARAKGVALANVVLALSDLVYLQATPTAIENISWKFLLLFVILSGLGTIALWFVLPETKGLTLEDMGKVFGDDLSTIAVLSTDLRIDEKTHRLMVQKRKGSGASNEQNGEALARLATEDGADVYGAAVHKERV